MRLDRLAPRNGSGIFRPPAQQNPTHVINHAALGVDTQHQVSSKMIAGRLFQVESAKSFSVEGRSLTDIGRLKQQVSVKARLQHRILAAAENGVHFLLPVRKAIFIKIDSLHLGASVHARSDPAHRAGGEVIAGAHKETELASCAYLFDRSHETLGRRRRLGQMDGNATKSLPTAPITQVFRQGGLAAVDDESDGQPLQRRRLRQQAANRVIQCARRGADRVHHDQTSP